MRTKLLALMAALFLAVPFAGVALAGGPPGEGDNPENSTGSEGKPCNADHGHPDDGLSNNPECDGDGENGNGNGNGNGENGENGDHTRCHSEDSLFTELGAGEFNTVGHELWDGGLQAPPLTEHPEADGEVTGPVYDGFDQDAPSPVREVGTEAACAGDFLIDEEAGGDL